MKFKLAYNLSHKIYSSLLDAFKIQCFTKYDTKQVKKHIFYNKQQQYNVLSKLYLFIWIWVMNFM